MTKILVVAPSWVGDAVLSQPLLTLLRGRDPGAVIDVLGPAWALPIYRRMAEVSGTIDSPFGHGQLALGQRWRLGRALAAGGYDRAYVLPNSFKSALVPRLAGIPARIGFVGEMRQPLLTDARPLDKQALPLMVERFAALAVPRGEPLPRPLPHPRLQVGAAEQLALMDKLGLRPRGRVACFCPGAEYGPAKRWPPQHFAALARELARQDYEVWLAGSAKEKELGEQVRQASGGAAANLCGRTSLDEAVVLLSRADVVVSNDSGLMHVAAALSRPLIALYGSSSPAFTPPLSHDARIVRFEVPCSPCFQRICPLGHFDCMMKLDPGRVAGEVRSAVR